MIEFALCTPILLSVLLGTWQFGYAFYVYDLAEQAVRAGARYAMVLKYTEGDPGDTYKNRVRRMVVFSDPDAPDNAMPVVPGLTLANVNVTPNVDAMGVPKSITVSIVNFRTGAVLPVTLNGKPRVEIPFVGAYEAVP